MVDRTTRPNKTSYPAHGAAKPATAAEFLACSRGTVYRMIRNGQLQSVRVCGETRIPWHKLWEIVGVKVQVPK